MTTIDQLTAAANNKHACCKCKATGVRLYRQYGMFLRLDDLLCTACSLQEQDASEPDGKHTIRWRVAFVPTEDGDAWGFGSVPDELVKWWEDLPCKL